MQKSGWGHQGPAGWWHSGPIQGRGITRGCAGSDCAVDSIQMDEKLEALAAPSGCFRRPPGITFRTVPLVGDDIGRILRTHRCCAKAGVGSLGTRPSNRKFTSNTICPSALRTFLKMFRVDHGVHSELPFVGGSTGVSLCRWRLLVSCLRYSLYRKSTDFN